MASLASLPDNLVLDIIEQLDTARDVAHLSSLSRQSRELVRQRGWKSFARARFPSMIRPADQPTSWSDVVGRLTYLDRCWEKRGLFVTFFNEKQAENMGRQRRQGRQSVLCHSVVDAHLLSPSRDELLVCGAGENLLVRLRPQEDAARDSWTQLKGKDIGYWAGTGDITAVTTIERSDSPEVVVGRANGELQLLAATGSNFGQSTQTLAPFRDGEADHRPASMKSSPGQLAISWTEWLPRRQLLASCKSSVLTLYDFSNANGDDLEPMAYYDAAQDSPQDEAALIRGSKFMGDDVVACALGGTREPLRWSKISPTGLHLVSAVHNTTLLDRLESNCSMAGEEKTTVRAIETVGNGNLLLGAWDDGTHRLVDIRTPSEHDAIYRDRFQPYQASSSLLVYGAERFIAGSNSDVDLRYFDLRHPKPYHHSTALPCSAEAPYPPRPGHGGAPDAKPGAAVGACEHWSGRQCTWHAQSRRDPWRPDATMYLGKAACDHVSSMAKASDGSASFYCGVRGAVAEAAWELAEDGAQQRRRVAPPGWAASRSSGLSLMETGVSLCGTGDWVMDMSGMPRLFHKKVVRPGDLDRKSGLARSRLDMAFLLDGERLGQRGF